MTTSRLVVRHLLARDLEPFKDKIIGLVLLASPSHGSAWANRVQWLTELFKNKMAGQLARDNDFLDELNRSFAELIARNKLPRLTGIDMFENRFIIRGFWWNSEYVVSAKDAASYFGEYKIIPDSDHFSIAKPTSDSDAPHHFLWSFYETLFLPLASAKEKDKQNKTVLEATKNTLSVVWPSLSDEFQIVNISNAKVKWLFKDFPKHIIALHGHATDGLLDPNKSSVQLQVIGRLDHIIAQTTKEHIFSIVSDDFSIQKEMRVITDDPQELNIKYRGYLSLPN